MCSRKLYVEKIKSFLHGKNFIEIWPSQNYAGRLSWEKKRWKLNQVQDASAFLPGLTRKTSLSICPCGSSGEKKVLHANKKDKTVTKATTQSVQDTILCPSCSLLSNCSLTSPHGWHSNTSDHQVHDKTIHLSPKTILSVFPSSENCRNVFQDCKIYQHQIHGPELICTCSLGPHSFYTPLCYTPQGHHYHFIRGTITLHPLLLPKLHG